MECCMMSLSQAAADLNAKLLGADRDFSGVSTDTRSVRPGELFVALRGERFDGHAFLDNARAAGAAAVLVDEKFSGEAPLPGVVVPDTRRALGELASHWRARFSPTVIAITGSNGKTTVKEMLAAVLRHHAGEEAVLATAGNLNNDIGVPLMLLRLRAMHRVCALELGMNHKGEIAYLARLVRPGIALVNNAQREHLEFMRSVEEVARENGSVYEALPPDGVAIVNAEDGHAAYFRRRAGARTIIDFGLGAGAVRGRYSLNGLASELELCTPAGVARARLSIPGEHNVRNALAAAACAHAAGVPPDAIAEGLTAFRPYTGRLQVKKAASGATVIDDSYNANPDSVRAAIDVLAACPPPTVLVLGDMGEVGEQGAQFHREVGLYAKAKGISRLLCTGALSRQAAEAFGEGGEHFDSIDAMAGAARNAASVLVKGSRFMKMERVVAALSGEAGTDRGGDH
jgi:UDP-N-acetylmuramoyl-tripeptide--D-alanyl-D-alanine ligase